MSFFLTKAVAERAIAWVLPAIEPLLLQGPFKRKHLHIVVARPDIPADSMKRERWLHHGILHEHSIGNTAAWEHPFAKIARSKTELSWRYGLPSQIIQARMPHVLCAADTIFFGSAVRDGLVVGVSGVQPWFDQMIAGWVLDACQALSIDGYEAWRTANPQAAFLPEE